MKLLRSASIQFQIISLVVLLLLSSGIFIVYFTVSTQRANLIDAMNRGVNLNTQTLMAAMYNMMLDGKAPLVVRSISDLQRVSDYKFIGVFRINGVMAFSDYQTLQSVNNNQKEFHFSETPRIKYNISETARKVLLAEIGNVLKNGTQKEYFYPDKNELEYFFPIENLKECMKCHMANSQYRGVINIRLSIAGTMNQIEKTREKLLIFFISVGIVLIGFLILFMRGLIVIPITKIGEAVKKLGKGDFNARVLLKRHDELGKLAEQINEMIKGLEERFILGRYVSSTTRSIVSDRRHEEEHPVKKSITVLFSDVRGFTSYTESHNPEEVVENLNRILETQAEAVEKHGGDVDKFVGDEIMAVFEDEYPALICAYEMINRVKKLNLGLDVGIGINTGEVLAGNIGSKNRQEYAVIGDTVNVASRLCSMAKPGRLLISEPFFREVRASVTAEKLEKQAIKGKMALIDIYQVKSIKKKNNVI